MSEELLKAIIQLFSIVSKERLTEDERNNINEFLLFHTNHETAVKYLELFDTYSREYKPEIATLEDTDEETIEFVDDWARIVKIGKQINEGLTQQQKLVLIVKIIELVFADGIMTERQSNLIFYIGEIIKIPQNTIREIEQFVAAESTDELDSKNILIIDEGSGEYSDKVKRIVNKDLTGYLVVLRIPETETYFVKYIGITSISLNGVSLKSRRVNIFPTGSTIRGNKINSIYYSDIISRFLREDSESELSFLCDHVYYQFKNGNYGLRDIYISEEGGKLMGIMGASGSGKSTLINVLNGSEKPTEGSVYINGIDIYKNKDEIEGIVGYVPQDDFLIEDLTVYQNLYYAAKLCFKNFSEEQIEKLVQKQLKNLGLLETKDLKVGSPLEKTISGGQRKRLNIGLELIREPSVLFVDEPTSGLSSRDSENIMDLLKELSLRGKMVFVVIHQPSSDIFKMFDSLIIMDVGGYQIYYGNPLEAVVYFKTIVNMANKDESVCINCGNVNAEQIFSIIETKVVNEFGRFTDERKVNPKEWREHFSNILDLPEAKKEKRSAIKSLLSIPDRFGQFKIFFTRDLLSKLSNKQYLIINTLEAPVLALFLCYIIRFYVVSGLEGEYTFYANKNIPVYFFMGIIVAIFMGLTVSAEEILRDRKILKRESFLNLSRFSYLSAKVAVLFGISAIQMFLFVIIGNSILQVPEMNFDFWLVMFSCAAFANLTGLNISSAFKSAVTIYILIPLLIIPQLVLSGVVIQYDRFNPKISTVDKIPLIGEVMATRWAYEAAVVRQAKDNSFAKDFYTYNKVMSNSRFKSGFYMDELKTKLSNIFYTPSDEMNTDNPQLMNDFTVLRNELSDRIVEFKAEDRYLYLDSLNPSSFNNNVYSKTEQFLGQLQNVYSARYSKANSAKDSVIREMTKTEVLKDEYNTRRQEYMNESIIDQVTSVSSGVFIQEYKGRLIQNSGPIYMDPKPINLLDFRGKFFLPQKAFLGNLIDTFNFNMGFIWFMSAFMWFLLYFDVLRKVIEGLGKIKLNRRFSKS